MTDLAMIPIVLMGVLEPEAQKMPGSDVLYGTAFGSYATTEGCRDELWDVALEYWRDWPNALFWCAEMVVIDMPERKTDAGE